MFINCAQINSIGGKAYIFKQLAIKPLIVYFFVETNVANKTSSLYCWACKCLYQLNNWNFIQLEAIWSILYFEFNLLLFTKNFVRRNISIIKSLLENKREL